MEDQTKNLAEADLRNKKRLFEQLEASPVVDVLGVVAPGSGSGAKSRGDTLWTMIFTFEVWRVGTADLQARALTIRREVTDEELERFRALITPYTVVRIRARVVIDSVFGSPQALLEEFVGLDDSDAELNDKARQLQEPVIHNDPVLGTFTLDRSVDMFEADAVWEGAPISLRLSVEESSDLQAPLKTAHSLWQAQSKWNQRIRDYAVQALLPLKNDTWLDDDEEEVTPDQFQDLMTLRAVTVYPDGSFEFWHNDGGLFWGHSILISGSLSEGPTAADIPG